MKTLYESILSYIDESILASSGAGKAKVLAEYQQYGLDPDKIKLNRDGSIDYDGDIAFEFDQFESTGLMPVRFNKVNGDFYCSYAHLTSLEGAPKVVSGSFVCTHNHLTSLEGAPHTVGKSFSCRNNNIISLKGGPKNVGDEYWCNINLLTNLEGAPKIIKGTFECSDNDLITLKGSPEKIHGDFYCDHNPLASIEHGPKHVGGVYYATNLEIPIDEVIEQLKSMNVCRKAGNGYKIINI